MSILNKLASALDRRDEIPNQELAADIVKVKDKIAVNELFENLNNKNTPIRSDCIKVIYEIGERDPSLIAGHASELIHLLNDKNNRIQWGAMSAIDTITLENPGFVFSNLKKILDAAEKGTVITKDHAVNILISLCSIKDYSEKVFPFLIDFLSKSLTNQLPMYAEKAIPVINDSNKKLFIKTLSSRLDDIEKDSKRKRVENVINKFNK